MSDSVAESLTILLDHDQAMERREQAARIIQDHGDVETLEALLKVLQGPWEREGDASYLKFRQMVAQAAYVLRNIRDQEGPPVFSYFPDVDTAVEARTDKVRRGRLRCGYGTSLYEFHWEYPIEGFGVRKDLIVVVEENGARTPIFDWCRKRRTIVLCNRCGEDITYQVNLLGCRFRASLRRLLGGSAKGSSSKP